jgi:hypothetical protein
MQIEDSRQTKVHFGTGSRRLYRLLAAMFLTGLLLLACVPALRPAKVRESNTDFLPFLSIHKETESTPFRDVL